MEFLNAASGQFLELIKDDTTSDSDDDDSVVSDASQDELVECGQPEWFECEVYSDGESAQGEEVIECSDDIRMVRTKDASIMLLTKPIKTEGSAELSYQTGRPSSNVKPQTIKEVFELFFNEELKNLILTHTNSNGQNLYEDKWKPLDSTELNAIVGLCIMAGVFKSKGQDTRELWEESIGIPRFRATSSFNRFQDVLRCMKFNESKTRKKSEPLTSVSEYLKIFKHSCKSNYIPSTEITLGQQFYPWRGRGDCVTFCMPQKPGMTGLKFWIAADALNNYCINITLNFSKTGDDSSAVINELCSHLYNQERRITLDGLHIDHDLASSLLNLGIFTIGPISNMLVEVPTEKNVKNPSNSAPKVLLSTILPDDSSQILKDYNRTKNAVDNLDQLLGTYSVKRKTKRWPMAVFYNTLDIACYNALVIWLQIHPKWSANKQQKRRHFLKQLALELTECQILLRADSQTLQRSTKRAIEHSGFALHKQVPAEEPLWSLSKRKRCHICPRSIDRKSMVTCSECRLPVCKQHSKATVVCRTCVETDFAINAQKKEKKFRKF